MLRQASDKGADKSQLLLSSSLFMVKNGEEKNPATAVEYVIINSGKDNDYIFILRETIISIKNIFFVFLYSNCTFSNKIPIIWAIKL